MNEEEHLKPMFQLLDIFFQLITGTMGGITVSYSTTNSQPKNFEIEIQNLITNHTNGVETTFESKIEYNDLENGFMLIFNWALDKIANFENISQELIKSRMNEINRIKEILLGSINNSVANTEFNIIEYKYYYQSIPIRILTIQTNNKMHLISFQEYYL